ncbi:MAG: PAS domain-containing sensor histidine kinase, partial [Bacteroidales bacterium]|nr:PAS domain-containing sensor histidine kinase [Bacteroidales bacterium]
NEDLATANDELESFAHTVSHDLRSPLNIILGYIQLITQEKAPILDEETFNFLGIVVNSAKSMANLIEDLLNFARSGKTAIQLKETDLSDIAEKVVKELRLKDRDREILIDIQKNMIVNADSHLMGVVMENLISNAWKYTSKSLSPYIKMGMGIQGSDNVFFIEDNGDGFDPKDNYKLFAAFQRLHLNSEFPGTGVGLATVKRIIDRHGGRIWANGEKGKGATFFFTLPE